MADKKISELTAVTNILDADAFIIARNGDNYQLTGAALNALIAAATANVPGPSFRNRIINGNFMINQRSVSGANTAYTSNTNSFLDGWKVGPSNSTYSYSQSGLDNLVSINSGTLLQIIKANQIEGGTYTLSWTGTAQARIGSGSAGAGAYAVSPITVTLSAATPYAVEFNTGTVTRVQLEPGNKATSFERRDDELIRCQKRFIRLRGVPLRGVIQSSNGYPQRMGCVLPVVMDSTPIVTLGGTNFVWDGTVSSNGSQVTGISLQYNTPSSIELDLTTGPAFTGAAYRPAMMYNYANMAGWIDVSCEP